MWGSPAVTDVISSAAIDPLTLYTLLLTFMATRRRSSVKSAPKIVKESVVSVKKVAVAPVKRVNKVTQHREIQPVPETPTPAKVRPEKPNLSFEDYKADAQVRWQIHQYETQELWNDLVKGYNFAKPIVVKSIDYVKDSYNRAFEVKETEAAD